MDAFTWIPIMCAIAVLTIVAGPWLGRGQETAEEKLSGIDPGKMSAEEYERLNQMRAGTYRKRGCSLGPGR